MGVMWRDPGISPLELIPVLLRKSGINPYRTGLITSPTPSSPRHAHLHVRRVNALYPTSALYGKERFTHRPEVFLPAKRRTFRWSRYGHHTTYERERKIVQNNSKRFKSPQQVKVLEGAY